MPGNKKVKATIIMPILFIITLFSLISSHAAQIRVECKDSHCNNYSGYTYLVRNGGNSQVMIQEPNMDIQLNQPYRGIWSNNHIHGDITYPSNQDIVFSPDEEKKCLLVVSVQKGDRYISKECDSRK